MKHLDCNYIRPAVHHVSYMPVIVEVGIISKGQLSDAQIRLALISYTERVKQTITYLYYLRLSVIPASTIFFS